MIKAILLDLDNTLIHNPDLDFARAFLGIADPFFEKALGIKDFHKPFRAAINAMKASDANPTHLNQQRVVDYLQQASGKDPQAINQAIADFYEHAFPQLEACIRPVEGAAALIEWLQSRGYTIIIATNPLYSARALEWRLRWAELNDNLDHYAFVTHAENMHTAKPHAAYYAEILARVGIEPDEAVMIGDGQKNDISPAQMLGMHTFHITANADENAGTFQDFIARVHEGWLDEYHPLNLQPAMIEPQYRGNISALYGMTATIKDHYWHQHPDPDEWSPIQIVCHLYDSENTVQRPRLQTILTKDNPFLAAPKEPPGPATFDCQTDGPTYMHKFAEARQETLAFLNQLPVEAWQRPARHSIFGPTTLLEMAHFTAQHDRLHLNQLCQTLGRCE